MWFVLGSAPVAAGNRWLVWQAAAFMQERVLVVPWFVLGSALLRQSACLVGCSINPKHLTFFILALNLLFIKAPCGPHNTYTSKNTAPFVKKSDRRHSLGQKRMLSRAHVQSLCSAFSL